MPSPCEPEGPQGLGEFILAPIRREVKAPREAGY